MLPLPLLLAAVPLLAAEPPRACRIDVVEAGTGWPVPLVELRTNHQVRLVSDNAGAIAFDLPELMGRETWFDVIGHGYEVPKDGFGFRGVRLTPESGKTLTVEVTRTIIAKRLGRLTGVGQFAESQKLGRELDWKDGTALGRDSVQNAAYRGRMFWLWGDTTVARYPLGVFDSTAATTAVRPLEKFEPPLRVKFDHYADDKGEPRGIAKMPGTGPTWVFGVATLKDKTGAERLVGCYSKVDPSMEVLRAGLIAWDDAAQRFEQVREVWAKSKESPKPPTLPEGNPVFWKDAAGKEWVLFGNPLPKLRCPATFEAWQDPAAWEVLKPQEKVPAAGGGSVTPHSGAIAWNPYRKRWVTVFTEAFGKPSAFGEVWYAEADAPTGPWGPAVKVLSHENYTFYNPKLHPEFAPDGSPVLLFEGTYTATFADKPAPTPRYDYNQMLYRLDLDDPRLAAARGK